MDHERLLKAYEKARDTLLGERDGRRYWTGRLSPSALSTATAVSALSLFRNACYADHAAETGRITVQELEYIEEILKNGVHWLVHRQNPDGGWGDTEKSFSNSSTTMLVKAAFLLFDSEKMRNRKKYPLSRRSIKPSTAERGSSIIAVEDILREGRRRTKRFGEPELEPLRTTLLPGNRPDQGDTELPGGLLRVRPLSQEKIGSMNDVIDRADQYLKQAGGIEGIIKRYGNDKTFYVPILTNAALAGIVPWSRVDQLPFERAMLPQSLFRFLRLQVVSYAVPALVAIGQVRFHHGPSKSIIMRNIRRMAIEPTLRKIQRMQPLSGGFLEATPLTAFVLMSLIACGKYDHLLVHSGMRFLLNSVAEDGSWPIDTNLASWVTSLSVNSFRVSEPSREKPADPELKEVFSNQKLARWILSSQHLKRHEFTGADPGGWGWTDLSGAVPDADDTPAAILALLRMFPHIPPLPASIDKIIPSEYGDVFQETIYDATLRGIHWLLDLQNSDGGFPTFCRGWGMLPFDKSSVDLTAHAVRAFLEWKKTVAKLTLRDGEHYLANKTIRKIYRSIARARLFLLRSQRSDGSWLPLWFGNQFAPNEENPVYGTSKALRGIESLLENKAGGDPELEKAALDGLRWFVKQQNPDRGWGCRKWDFHGESAADGKRVPISSIEETACAIEAIAPFMRKPSIEKEIPGLREVYENGLAFLVECTEDGSFTESSPIGFYFASLWYFEELYPIIFTVSALARALEAK